MTEARKPNPNQKKGAERREVILATLVNQGRPCLTNYLRAVVNTRTRQGVNEPRVYQDVKRLEEDGYVTTESITGLGQAFGMSPYRAQKMLLVRLATKKKKQ